MARLVILSPGHSSTTAGKCSPDKSFYEWKFNREIVDLVAEGLKREGIQYVILDYDTKRDVPLKERVATANKYGRNALYVSVHSNAAGNGSKWMNARGFSAFTSKGYTKSDPMCEIFMKVAEKMLPAVGAKIRKYSNKKYGWEENFYVLKNTIMPAVLTESLFYDNKQDLAILQSEEGKAVIAQIHIAAIREILKQGL